MKSTEKDSLALPIVLVLLAVCLLLRGWSFHFSSLDDDEGIYLLMGRFLLQGHLPYIHFWDHQAPFIFFLSAAAQFLPIDGIVSVRVLGMFFVAGTAFMLYRIGFRVCGERIPGVVAASFYCYIVSIARWGGLAFNNEIILNAFAVLSLDGILTRLESRRVDVRSYMIPGLWIGLGFLTKMQALFDFIPFCLLIIYFGRGDRSWKYRVSCLASYVFGAALPHGMMMGVYLAAGSLSDYIHANWIANLGYISGEHVFRVNLFYNLKRLVGFVWMLPVWGCFLFDAFGRKRKGLGNHFFDHPRFLAFMAVWIVTIIWSTTLSKTFYIHYFLQLFPALSLMTGFAATLMGSHFGMWKRLSSGFVFIVFLFVFVLRTGGLGKQAGGPVGGDSVKRAAEWILKNKRRGDTMYVSDGDIVMYYLCEMDIPTRYAFPIQLNRKKYGPMYKGNQKKELKRILEDRPSWIVSETGVDSAYRDFEDPEMKMIFETALKSDYKQVNSVRVNINRLIRIYRIIDSETGNQEGISTRSV